ncbi:MAG: hypothetical protein JW699_01075 [Chitinispirillaceae bacterium]|nr:hypothetical protein [Chitinispirillaceae bacterium]
MEHPFDRTDLLQYATGSCDAAKRRAFAEHLASCPACSARVGAIEAEKKAFLSAHPFETTVTLPERMPVKRTVPFFRQPLYAIAASLVIFIGAGFLYTAGSRHGENRIKGETGLKVYVQNRAGTIEKREPRVFFAGEKIQFLYSCGADNRFILLSIDTAGVITTYYPAAGDSSSLLEQGRDIPLPNSIVLDEYTGRELFIGLFSKKALSAAAVREHIARAFAASRDLDSLDLKGMGATAVTCACTVLKGGR